MHMHKPESVLENKISEILWYLEIKTHHPIQAGKSDRVVISKKKRTCHLVNFILPTDQCQSKGKHDWTSRLDSLTIVRQPIKEKENWEFSILTKSRGFLNRMFKLCKQENSGSRSRGLTTRKRTERNA